MLFTINLFKLVVLKIKIEGMNQVRVTYEWVFGDVINYFKHGFQEKLDNRTELCR